MALTPQGAEAAWGAPETSTETARGLQRPVCAWGPLFGVLAGPAPTCSLDAPTALQGPSWPRALTGPPALSPQTGRARGCAPDCRGGSTRSSGSMQRISDSSPRRAPWRRRSRSAPGGGAALVARRLPPAKGRASLLRRARAAAREASGTAMSSLWPRQCFVTSAVWGGWVPARPPSRAHTPQ